MKKFLQRILNSLGIEIRLMSSLRHQLREAYPEQVKILNGIPVKTIFDVGAYDGTTSIKYHSYFPLAACHSFEPFPASFASLQKNAEVNKYITPVNAAVGEKPGTSSLFVNEEPMTNSLYEPSHTESFVDDLTKNKTRVEVNVITLDEYATSKNISSVDILKLDVQGGELNVLKGAASLLAEKKIKLIYCEVEFSRIYDDQPLFHEICAYLDQHGYYLFGFYNLVHYKNGQLVWGDAIFISSTLNSKLLSNRKSG